MKKTFPLFDIYWDNKDVELVTNVIKRGSYWANGPEIKIFEKKIAEYLGVKYVITFNSGTSALHAALLAFDITDGKVIIPSFSFISTANCVILSGATPVFAEIEQESFGLDLEDVKNKISNDTKAIIPMHYGGRICKNINALKDLAEDHNLILIEDNAESFGATIKDRYAGTIGHSGMLSFCQNKIITTGEGGAICTDDEDIYKKLILIRSHGRVEQLGTDYFSSIFDMDYIQIGYNYRMPTICAALGISQLEKIDQIIQKRREIGKYYDENLKKISEINTLSETEGSYNVYQLYTVMLRDPKRRDELQEYLLDKGIYTKVYFYPIHLKSIYRQKYGYDERDLPITESISKKVISLPFSFKFSKEDQDFIINSIKEFF